MEKTNKMTTEVKQWAKYALVAVIFVALTLALTPAFDTTELDEQIKVLTLDNEGLNTSLGDANTLVDGLNGDLDTANANIDSTSTELLDEKNAHALTLADLEAVRELPLDQFNFNDWFLGLFDEAEEDAELEYNGTFYEGDDGEWDFRDYDAELCVIYFEDDTDELLVECDDVELKTDDGDRITCDFEFDVEDMEYDGVEISNCVED